MSCGWLRCVGEERDKRLEWMETHTQTQTGDLNRWAMCYDDTLEGATQGGGKGHVHQRELSELRWVTVLKLGKTVSDGRI